MAPILHKAIQHALNIIKKSIIALVIISCASMLKTHAQLGFCSGNSGDPIFTENFGTGTGNNALPVGTTTYNYKTVGYPDDGEYSISNGTFGNPFIWHEIEDHTPGDTNGKLLIVNAEANPGEFYRTEILGLCENTTYEFSAFLINLVRLSASACGGNAIPINVRFEIRNGSDTIDLVSGNTGNIEETANVNWEEYGLVFNTGNETSVILRIINNGVGGCGNDLAIDDIEFKTCGANVSVSDASNNTSIPICSGELPFSTTISATPNGSYAKQWQERTDGTNWTDIAGENGQSLSFTITTPTDPRYYRIKVAEVAGNLNDSQCNSFSNAYQVILTPSPPLPPIECWETATLNPTNCTWVVTGTQPVQPTLECWQTVVFDDTTCLWDVSGTQPVEPDQSTLECWETTTFNTATCSWDVSGTQPVEPEQSTLACWETTNFNTATCEWDILGTEPAQPSLECWETVTFNTTTCTWDISGTQPVEPDQSTLACGETAAFNTVTCAWEVSGSSTVQPNIQCYETAIFNSATCIWDISGTQPEQPIIECYEAATFNETSCAWEVTGTQPEQPVLACRENATFNTDSCAWEVSGSPNTPPDIACYETATFNDATCVWDITGTQPEQPRLEYWETALFNATSCNWDISGTPALNTMEENRNLCAGNQLILLAYTAIEMPTFIWNTGATTEEIIVDTPGVYSVEISNGVHTLETIIYNVNTPEVPIIKSVVSTGNDISITNTGQGNFLYSIDGTNFQTGNTFNNVEIGLYTIYVKDSDCDSVVSSEHFHFDIPKFFTPNNDGANDIFYLSGIENFNTSQVAIFDRYGKLLKLSSNGPFEWDGTYSNQIMPSGDYWYRINIEGQKITGHITLKR